MSCLHSPRPHTVTPPAKAPHTMPLVLPKNCPSGFVPFYASTAEYAEDLRSSIENHAKSKFDMKLDWDEADTDKWITVTFEYGPKYLFDMVVIA